MKIAITGSTGFVGKELATEMKKRNHELLHLNRRLIDKEAQAYIDLENIDINDQYLINNLFSFKALIHCAGIPQTDHKIDQTIYEKVNVESALRLFKLAEKAQVSKFIFLSTIKVNGESTFNRNEFSEDDLPLPQDPYSLSKKKAEDELLTYAKNSKTTLIILRPTIIYGETAKGSFGLLIKLAQRNIPIPYIASSNKRSILSIYNLIDFIEKCLYSNIKNSIYTLADDTHLTPKEIAKQVRNAYNSKSILIPIPSFFCKILLTLFRKKSAFEKLTAPLTVSNKKAKYDLDWQPIHLIKTTLNKARETK